MSVIAYLRVSTEKQHIENQKDEIRRFAASRSLTIDRWVTETVSGKTQNKDRKLGPLLRRMQSGDTLATRMEQLLEEKQAANNAEEENPEEASYSEDTDRTDAEAEQAEEETPRLVCSIAVLYGKWGNNTAFTPTTEDGVWSADGLSSWLGDYVTPGKDLLLVLDGEDCPFDSGDAAMLQDGSAVTKAAQKLLILDPDNKIYEATPENAEKGEAS